MIKKNRVLRIKNHEGRINWLKKSGQTVPEAQLTFNRSVTKFSVLNLAIKE